MDDKKLQEIFKRAAEVASVVPETMHAAAFNRAVDALMGNTSPAPAAGSSPIRKAAAQTKIQQTKPDDFVTALLALDRSKAPEVDAAEGGMSKALALMLVARRELNIDGLTTPQMATVLTEKFRHRVTRQALNQAMDRAGNKVDRFSTGRTVRYRIMQAGEDWLAAPANPEPPTQGKRPASTVGARRRRKAKVKEAATGSTSTGAPVAVKATSPSKPKRSASRAATGPKAAVEQLIAAGWFEKPRGLTDIRVELEQQQARRFKATDLSPAMTRLLREGRLKRIKTETGQYAYHA